MRPQEIWHTSPILSHMSRVSNVSGAYLALLISGSRILFWTVEITCLCTMDPKMRMLYTTSQKHKVNIMMMVFINNYHKSSISLCTSTIWTVIIICENNFNKTHTEIQIVFSFTAACKIWRVFYCSAVQYYAILDNNKK